MRCAVETVSAGHLTVSVGGQMSLKAVEWIYNMTSRQWSQEGLPEETLLLFVYLCCLGTIGHCSLFYQISQFRSHVLHIYRHAMLMIPKVVCNHNMHAQKIKICLLSVDVMLLMFQNSFDQQYFWRTTFCQRHRSLSITIENNYLNLIAMTVGH